MTFNHIRLFTAATSLLLSIAAFYFDDIINRDGVMYMEMVEAYLSGGLSAMASIYDWPFFTLLVAWLSDGLTLPPQFTASGLNSLFYVVFTDALLLISRLLLPNLRQVAMAAVLILCFFTINDYRDFIIRDVGYWAFSTLALYQLLKFSNKPDTLHAVSWQVSIVIATLFRIEGIVLLTLLPFTVIYRQSLKQAAKKLLSLNSLLLPLLLLLSVVALSQAGWVTAFDKLDDYLGYFNTDTLTQLTERRLAIFEDKVLAPFSVEYSHLIFFSGLLAMLAYKLIEGLSASYIVLLLMAWWQNRQLITMPYRHVILWFICLNVLILIAFLFRSHFVVSRYCVMTVTGLFLMALPYITRLIEHCWQNRRYGLLAFISLIVIAGPVDTFHSTNSKAYIKNTAIWAAHHLQASDRILTDDEFLQYYFKREKTALNITYRRHKGLGDYRRFDYLIKIEKHRNKEFEPISGTQLELVYQQENRRGNKASVYRVVRYDE